MSGYGFTSAFATELEEYLVFKENMGFYGSSRIWYLKRFDAYCVEHDRKLFDRDTVEGWVTEQLKRSGRYRSWMSYIRDFGRWLGIHGNKNAERVPKPKVHNPLLAESESASSSLARAYVAVSRPKYVYIAASHGRLPRFHENPLPGWDYFDMRTMSH